MSLSPFTQNVIKIIKNIPAGKVLTYGIIAIIAGNPRGARQVSWVLNSLSSKHQLPWHRVINSKGKISLGDFTGYTEQKELLEQEGILFGLQDKIDLNKFLWQIKSIDEI